MLPAAPRTTTPAWLTRSAVGVCVILTGTAFWLSYQHLAHTAASHGLGGRGPRSWAWPATIDLFVIMGELLILLAALAGRHDGWAIALVLIGSGGSVALNVAGVGSNAAALDYVVAAVPPVAALLAFGVLMRQVRERLTTRVVPPMPERPPEVLPRPARSRTETPRKADKPTSSSVRPAPSPGDFASRAAEPRTPTAAEAAILPLYELLGARPKTGQMLAAMANAGIMHPAGSTARDARSRLERLHPDLLVPANASPLSPRQSSSVEAPYDTPDEQTPDGHHVR